MYKLVPAKKKQSTEIYHYVFDGFKVFYSIACGLTVPLKGKYYICVKSDNVNEILEFISNEGVYSYLMVDIITQQNIIDFITMRDQHVNTAENVSPYHIFKELIKQRELLFDSVKTIDVLYGSIEHSEEDMVKALDLLVSEIGVKTMITEDLLGKYFILNKVVYPRQVLTAYLKMTRWRESKLEKCLSVFGNDVMLGSFVKTLKTLVKDKAVYYRTGKDNYLIRDVDIRNILMMYRIFVVERYGMNDIHLLLDYYERGVTGYDLIQRDKDVL